MRPGSVTVGQVMVLLRASPNAAVDAARLSDLPAHPAPQRARDHVVILASTGQGTHTLDFVTHPCRPGTLLWGRPGPGAPVRRPGRASTRPSSSFRRRLLPPLPVRLVADPFAPACWQPAGEDEEAIVAEIAQIAVDRPAATAAS